MAGHVRPATLRRPGGTGPATPGVVAIDPLSPAVSVSTPVTDSAGAKKLIAPNKKQHESDLKDVADRIASREREMAEKKKQFAIDAVGNTARRAVLPEEIKTASDRLMVASEAITTMNSEIAKKQGEINKLRPRMTYRSESDIDRAMNQLEHRRIHGNFSLPDEQKIIREIDKLRRSKNELRSYNKLMNDTKGMEASLKERRDSRQACYFGAQKLSSEEKCLKETDRRHKDEVDAIMREIQDLHHRRQQMIREYEHRVAEWEAHVAANRRWRHVIDQQVRSNRNAESQLNENVVRDPYAGQKQIVSGLLTYLQPYVRQDEGLLLPVILSSFIPSTSASVPATSAVEDGAPGYFLPKKYSDSTTPTRGTFSKARNNKKKIKPIAHSAAVVAQFTSLDLLPPANTSEVPAAIEALHAKKLDLDKQTVAKFASMTPKNSPTDELLPPLPGPCLEDGGTIHENIATTLDIVPSFNEAAMAIESNLFELVSLAIAALSVDETDSVPSIIVTSVSTVGEADPDTSCSSIDGSAADSEAASSIPTSEVSTSDSSAQSFSCDEGTSEMPISVKTGIHHSFTNESISETDEDFSAASVCESTAENSGEEEEGTSFVVRTLFPRVSKPTQNALSVRLSSGGGRNSEIIELTAFPETPPIDEAFTKPLFSSASLDEKSE